MTDCSQTDNTQKTMAIIGIGCIFPKAGDLQQYWCNIKNRVDAISDIPKTHWAIQDCYYQDPKTADRTYAKRGGFLPATNFDPLKFAITPNTVPIFGSNHCY